MRLISWNVQSLKAGPDRVVGELMRYRPDIVALQEFRVGVKGRAVAEYLTRHGLPFRTWGEAGPGICSALFARPGAAVGRLPPSLAEPAPYWCEIELGEIGVSGVHIPISSYKELRRSYWEAALLHCREVTCRPHVFLGDLNTTRHFVDEAGKTIPGNQHLAALEEMGWIEALRTCHPGPQAGSWYSTIGNGFRVDQAWLSPPLINRLVSAELDHSVRAAGYSDHSLLVVEVKGE